MIASNLQSRVDRFSDRKGGHLDHPATQILSRNTTRGISMKHIKLTQGQFALVDDEDFDKVSKYRWYVCKGETNTYAKAGLHKDGKWTSLQMHRLILGAEKGQYVDHINGNGLDNQSVNLRICTSSQNQQNRRIYLGFSSKYKGVCWSKLYKKWQSYIKLDGKLYCLGRFNDEIKAASAYDKRAKELFGEFALLNFKET